MGIVQTPSPTKAYTKEEEVVHDRAKTQTRQQCPKHKISGSKFNALKWEKTVGLDKRSPHRSGGGCGGERGREGNGVEGGGGWEVEGDSGGHWVWRREAMVVVICGWGGRKWSRGRVQVLPSETWGSPTLSPPCAETTTKWICEWERRKRLRRRGVCAQQRRNTKVHRAMSGR